jgi:hypothetical protein
MTIVIASLILSLSWFLGFRPWLVAQKRADALEFERVYRRFKLYAVAKYHPAFQAMTELRHLTLDEVARIFDIERAYDDLRVSRVYTERFF